MAPGGVVAYSPLIACRPKDLKDIVQSSESLDWPKVIGEELLAQDFQD